MPGSAYFILKGNDLDRLGAAIAATGDLQGGPDRIADFVVGTPGNDTVGALLYSGFDSLIGGGAAADGSALTKVTFSSSTPGDQTGQVVLGGYDFNGDGVNDFAISAPDTGKVFIIYGYPGLFGSNLTEADLATKGAVLTGASGFGTSLAAADLDGDGRAELYVGRPVDATGRGSVAAFEHDGTGFVSRGILTAPAEGDGFAQTMSALRDINGDGYHDLVIAAAKDGTGPQNARGAAYVLFGNNGDTPLSNAVFDGSKGFKIIGAQGSDMAGAAVANAGDLNDDGIPDLLVTAPQSDANGVNSGAVAIIYGKAAGGFPATIDLGALGTAGLLLKGSVAGEQLGLSATGVGDVSGDGLDDLLIAGKDAAGSLKAYLLFGGTFGTGTRTLGSLSGNEGFVLEGLPLGLGSAAPVVAAIGDINNDNIPDLALGAPDHGETASGAALVLLGGANNFAQLDGDGDKKIALAPFAGSNPPAVNFVATDITVTFTGSFSGAIDLRSETGPVTGVFSIADVNDATARFDTLPAGTPEGIGQFGTLEVAPDGNSRSERWTYTLGALTALEYLGAGESITDPVLLRASTSRQKAVIITITGRDDPTVVSLTNDLGLPFSTDFASFSGTITVTDPDQNDTPSLAGRTLTGSYGKMEISADGTRYSYFLNDTVPQLSAGEALTERFSTQSGTIPVEFGMTIAAPNAPPTGGDGQTPYVLSGTGATAFFGKGAYDITGTTGDDRIDTGAGDSKVTSGDGNDHITDPFGNDVIDTGAGHNKVFVMSGTNKVAAAPTSTGSNYFAGGIGRDTLKGGAGKDILDGDAVSAFLGASDRLIGGAGDDVLRGGIGADVFVFAPNEGTNRIANFASPSYSQSHGYSTTGFSRDFDPFWDKIELSAFPSISTAAEALAAFRDSGSHATLSADGTIIILHMVASSELSADNFVLV